MRTGGIPNAIPFDEQLERQVRAKNGSQGGQTFCDKGAFAEERQRNAIHSGSRINQGQSIARGITNAATESAISEKKIYIF